MKITFVTPRYGIEIVGGAEHAVRMLAERLVSHLDWQVEILSSTATDVSTWNDELKAGESELNGVQVRRFATSQPRSRNFLELSQKVHANPKLVRAKDEDHWIDAQGPFVPEILEVIADCDADLMVFYPYLYYPTVRGLPIAKQPSILHPAAHDEAAIKMPIYSRVFSLADGFVFQTEGERRLSEKLFPIAARPQLLLGLGVEPLEANNEDFRSRFGIGDRPYLVCVGRVDSGKGSMLLAKYFTEYKHRNISDLALVFIGPIIQPLDYSDVIISTGIVSEQDKWTLLRNAEILVQPSPLEAFSLALIEGWAAELPALVNGSCVATTEHVQQSRGGLVFDGYASFESSILLLMRDRQVSSGFATTGHQYVSEHFNWPALINRYGQFIQQIANRKKVRHLS